MESQLLTGRRRQPPAPATSVVGRSVEVDHITRLLLDPAIRLVSLVGPGGVGKTRLATNVYLNARSQFSSGGAFTLLSTLTDPERAAETIAQDLGLAGFTNGAPIERLTAQIGDDHLLLFADGVERIDSQLSIFSDLLAECHNLKVLITSRHRLNLAGETTVHVPPLPQPTVGMSEFQIRNTPAVELFVDRSRAIDASFDLTEENAADVAAICRQLDGLPLAIELAAVQVGLLSPNEILRRLEGHAGLPIPPPRDLSPRHRSLELVMASSFELLTDEERETLARLTVFTGSFSVAAAEAVLVPDASQTADSSHLALLGSLVNKSLIVRESAATPADRRGSIRFSLLGMIRDYASLLLGGHETIEQARSQHADFFRSLAMQLEPPTVGAFDDASLRTIELELPNFRSALDELFENAPERAVDLAAALAWFWAVSGMLGEGIAILERAGGLVAADSLVNRAKIDRGLGFALFLQGHSSEAEPYYRGAMQLYEQTTDIARAADAKSSLSALLVYLGRFDEAEILAIEAIADSARFSNRREADFVSGTTASNVGMVAYSRGQLEIALEHFRESAEALAAVGVVFAAARCRRFYACTLCDVGRIREGLDLLRDILAIPSVSNDLFLMIQTIRSIGSTPGQYHQAARAAMILGAASAIEARSGARVNYPIDQARLERAITVIRATIGREGFERAFEDGANLSIAEAIQEAREFARRTASTPVETAPPRASEFPLEVELSQREVDVLRLLAQRLPNREIGTRLSITERTVKKHVGNILAKLGVANRSLAVKRARELELL